MTDFVPVRALARATLDVERLRRLDAYGVSGGGRRGRDRVRARVVHEG